MFVFFHAHIFRAPFSTQIFLIIQINAFESRLFPSSIFFFFSHASILFAFPLPTHTSHISKSTSSNPRSYIYIYIFFFTTHFIATYIPHHFFLFLFKTRVRFPYPSFFSFHFFYKNTFIFLLLSLYTQIPSIIKQFINYANKLLLLKY